MFAAAAAAIIHVLRNIHFAATLRVHYAD